MPAPRIPARAITDPAAIDLAHVAGQILGRDPEFILRAAAEQRRRREQRIANGNARFADALSAITPVQAAKLADLEASGHRRTGRVWTNRETGNTAVVLQKQAFNEARGSLGTKLVVVYPDGTTSQTFERSIHIRPAF